MDHPPPKYQEDRLRLAPLQLWRMPPSPLAGLFLACALGACGGSTSVTNYGQSGTRASFDLDADLSGQGGTDGFYALPFPSDLRLTPDGHADWRAFSVPKGVDLVEGFRATAQDRSGFSVVAVAFFRFSAPMAQAREQPVPAGLDQPVLLIDVDPDSPERGKLFPLWLHTPPEDDYLPANVIALAPRPGIVLAPKRKYAFVVRRALNDAAGKSLGVPSEIDQLRQGKQPAGALGAAAVPLFAPLWATLKTAGLDTAQVAAATVFTTGDAVAEVAALSDALLAKYTVTLDALALDVAASTANDRICKLTATVPRDTHWCSISTARAAPPPTCSTAGRPRSTTTRCPGSGRPGSTPRTGSPPPALRCRSTPSDYRKPPIPPI